MSWGIKAVGTPAAIKARVAEETNMPQGLKDAIAEFCDVPADSYNNGVLVESFGSHGTSGSFALKFERVQLAVSTKDPAPPITA